MDHPTREARTGAESTSSKGNGPTSALLTVLPAQEYNRKNRRPSEDMTESDGSHYRCPWIDDCITVHSDGNVTCGLDDPHGQRSFGNVKETPIEEIYKNPEFANLQKKLWDGHRCRECGLYRRVDDEADAPAEVRPRLPKALVVETTVKCNLRCPNTACIPNNDAMLKTRDSDSLSLETLRDVTDQLSTSLETIHFYNYGEPFLNKQAEDMMLYLREKCPGALITTSTNAILLANPSRAEKVVLAAPDRIIVSISGVTQEVYGIYHAAGKCEKALAGLKNLCDAKRRFGRTLPAIVVRYLVFHWNDSDEQIDAAIAMAEEYGVDRLVLHLTDEPAGARSARFSPGSPSYFKYLKYIRRDHTGRLDHLYHCELPDEDGLYRPEDMPEFGILRRTASEATLWRNGRNGRVRVSIGTDRPLSREREQSCLLRTPWQTVKVPLTYGKWQPVSIRVPRAFRRSGPVEIQLTADDYWFPAAEWGNADLRCLGVLVRAGGLIEAGSPPRHLKRLRMLATLRRSWRRRISRTVPGRILSSWYAALADLSGRLRPADAGVGGQAPSRVVEDPACDAEERQHAQAMTRMYRTVFGRSPDPEGLRGWVDVLLNGNCVLVQVAQDFVASAEFRAIHGRGPGRPPTSSPPPAGTPSGTSRTRPIAGGGSISPPPPPLTEHGYSKAARAATALGIMDSMTILDATPGADAAHSAIPRPHFRRRSYRGLALLRRERPPLIMADQASSNPATARDVIVHPMAM